MLEDRGSPRDPELICSFDEFYLRLQLIMVKISLESSYSHTKAAKEKRFQVDLDQTKKGSLLFDLRVILSSETMLICMTFQRVRCKHMINL